MSGSGGGLTIPLHGAFGRISAAVLSHLSDREFYQKSIKFAPKQPRQIQVFRDEAQILQAAGNLRCQPVKFAFFRLDLFGSVVFNKLPRYEFNPLARSHRDFTPKALCDDFFLKVSS